MYLKQLDMQGFKSFPEKVKLEFNKGITAVVGPNGSGKSNVSDAVRWVLGEQRAKSLRGEKMEDIIFAGTQSRKPLGFAEVTITIDNADHKMPIDYTEVAVSRRVFRSGESEYHINGVGCRLKDVHELFMDTGVGKEGYSIIGQGRIDEILSQKGEDRRRLFEEAAGIVKYKTRKTEAFQKLEREQQNLQRVEDIIAELSGQLAPLQEQSEQAKNYLTLRESLKSAELALFCIEVDKLEQELSEFLEKQRVLQEAALDVTEQSKQSKIKNTQALETIDDLTMQIQSINDQIVEIRTKLEKKDGEVRLNQEQIQNFQKDNTRIEQENEKRQKAIEQNIEEMQLTDSKIAAVDIHFHMEQKHLQELENELSKLSQALAENETLANAYQTEIVEQIKISTQVKGDLGKRELMAVQLEKRKEQLIDEKNHLQSQMYDNQTHLKVLEKQLENMDEQEKSLLSQMKNIAEEISRLKQLGERLAVERTQMERGLNEKKSRFKILSDMEKEHEGYFKSVKSILQLKNQNTKWQGICGAVGEILQVEAQYEAAIEAALGGAVQNIVTKTEDDAKEAINYLKQNHLGRATFLPISAIKHKGLGQEAKSILAEPHVLGTADELVSYDSEYQAIMSSLLGRTLVVETLEDGVRLAKKYRHQYRLVTLDGDILNPGGAMTGGSAARKTTSIFGRSREIKELGVSIEEISAKLQGIGESLSDCRQELTKLDAQSLEQKMERQKLEFSKQSAHEDMNRTNTALKEQTEKLSLYELEESQLFKQQTHAQDDLDVLQQKLAKAEEVMQELNSRLSGFQDSLESEKQSREKLLAEITELKIKLSSLEQQKETLLETKKRIQQENEKLQEACKNAFQEQQKLLELISRKNSEIELIKQGISAVSEQEQQKQRDLVTIADKRKALQEESAALLKRMEELASDAAKLQSDLYRIETKIEKTTEEKQHYYDQIWEDYECTYHMAKEVGEQTTSSYSSYSVLKQDAKRYRERIKALGNINVAAIEQYKEVSQRHTFLTNQKQDILDAEEKLETIIAELSKLMEERFREQIQLISQNFNEVFQEMFGGGKAYLKLSDENAILDSSIEIIAQPPGKSLQNMLLLSGGERALTAIAILFSILKMKPSPFCILDEIEAALDDANVKRYAKYLTKFSGDTQFIVITHRKGTMEAADVLYGVTMQEKGVSKLISVNFQDQQYA